MCLPFNSSFTSFAFSTPFDKKHCKNIFRFSVVLLMFTQSFNASCILYKQHITLLYLQTVFKKSSHKLPHYTGYISSYYTNCHITLCTNRHITLGTNCHITQTTNCYIGWLQQSGYKISFTPSNLIRK